MQQILIVDDDKTLAESLHDGLADEGYRAEVVTTGEEAVKRFDSQPYELVFLDLRLPGMDGLAVLGRLREIDPKSVVIVMTAYGDESTAFRAARMGAYDYITKPFDLERVKLTLANAMEKVKLRWEVERLRQTVHDVRGPDRIVGESRVVKEIFQFIDKVSQSLSTAVLIEGESGTGKELVARAIHYRSFETPDRPFVEVNCAAMPENLLESELFGYEQGAFTDAKRTKKGIVELAHGGSLFLDEIGEMGPGLQSKLLRFIETKRFKRVGGQQDITVDIRIIAASNQDLKRMVDEGRFRPDLYYRLSVLPITIAPLRERSEDIPLLAEYFVAELNRDLKRQVTGIASEAMAYLIGYSWPGNIRELRNVIERAMILESEEEILPGHLPPEIVRSALGDFPEAGEERYKPFVPQPLGVIERSYIEKTLDYFKGNKSEAARVLGISRQTLREKLKDKKPE